MDYITTKEAASEFALSHSGLIFLEYYIYCCSYDIERHGAVPAGILYKKEGNCENRNL